MNLRSLQIFKYWFTSVVTFIVDIILLAIFVEILDIPKMFSVTFAFIISTSLGYLLNREWTYYKIATTNIYSGYLKSVLSALFTLIFILVCMMYAIDILNYNYMFSRIVIGILAFFVNYILDRKYSFGIRSTLI